MVSNSLVVKSPQKRLACLFFSDILLATWLDVSWSFWKLDHRGAKSDQTSDSQITRECQGKQVGDSTISHLFINTDYDGGAWYYCVTSEGSDTINKVIISICSFCTTEQKLTFCPKAQLLGVRNAPKNQKSFCIKNWGICISTNANHSVWKSPKKSQFSRQSLHKSQLLSLLSIFWRENSNLLNMKFYEMRLCLCFQTLCNYPLFAKKKKIKGDKVMIRVFMPIYSPINSEIGLNLKRATLQGTKP